MQRETWQRKKVPPRRIERRPAIPVPGEEALCRPEGAALGVQDAALHGAAWLGTAWLRHTKLRSGNEGFLFGLHENMGLLRKPFERSFLGKERSLGTLCRTSLGDALPYYAPLGAALPY